MVLENEGNNQKCLFNKKIIMIKNLKKLIREMIPVILGIIIALFINNWKERINDQRFIKKALSSIRSELLYNKEDLDSTLVQQLNLLDTLQFYIDDPSQKIIDIVGRAGGFQMPAIRNTSWKSFLNSRIELVEYKTISYLTEIEEFKDVYKLKQNKILDFGYSNLDASTRKEKETFLLFIKDIIDTESQLVELHEAFLDNHP